MRNYRIEVNTNILISIQEEEISISQLYDFCLEPDCGAVVVFSGTVRSFSEGRLNVTSLVYEAYTELAIKMLSEIAERVFELYQGVRKIAIVHRLGLLSLCESSVVVAVSSEHREEAFQGARFAIDTLKARAPIWKKETWSGGEDWSENASTIVDL